MKINWTKTASVLFCILVVIGALFLVGKYVLAVIMPFLIAWGTALAIRPAAKMLAKKTHFSERATSVIILIAVFAVLGTLLFLGINRLLNELGRLIDGFTNGENTVIRNITHIIDEMESVGTRLPFLNESDEVPNPLREKFDQMVASLLHQVASSLLSSLTSFASNLFRALPAIALFILVTIIATFYFSLDLKAVHGYLSSLLPPSLSQKIPQLKARVKRFTAKYLRAYLFLMFLTFCELFAGFSILGTTYSFLPALAISAVDIFPVLGVGTILVPWSVVELLSKDFRMGFGLLIMWIVITVVRQIVEPRIVGGSLGLHPILTLVGMYVGFRLFGIGGMLLSPAVLLAVKVVLKEWYPPKKASELRSEH